jgi:hypothetical protein
LKLEEGGRAMGSDSKGDKKKKSRNWLLQDRRLEEAK